MPTYEYRCTSCGHQFEKVQKFTDEAIKVCPVCGQTVRKVFHPAGVVFKGSGWYINDSRKTNGKTDKTINGEKDKDSNSEKTETSKDQDKEKVESPAADTSKTDNNSSSSEGGKTETKTEKAEPKKSDSPAAPAA